MVVRTKSHRVFTSDLELAYVVGGKARLLKLK